MKESQDIQLKPIRYIFCKIVEKQYVNSIVNNGKIYFNLLSNYRKLDVKDKKTEIGDNYEGHMTAQAENYLIINNNMIPINIFPDNNQVAFCCYWINLEENNTILSNDEYTLSFNAIEKLCKDKEGGIDNCYVIVFYENIFKKIEKELKKRGLSYKYGPVKYDDFNYKPVYPIDSKQYRLECCFHKNNKYRYQNEYRIVALNTINRVIDDIYIDLDKYDFNIIPLQGAKSDLIFTVSYKNSMHDNCKKMRVSQQIKLKFAD